MARRAWLRYALAGAAMYGVALAATAPASVAEALLSRAIGPSLELTGSSGNLWSGRAARAFYRARDGEPLALGALSWRVHPLGLLTGALDVSIQTEGRTDLRADIALRPGSFALRQASGTADARFLAVVLPKLAAWKPSGTLRVASSGFVASRTSMDGALTLDWRGACFGTCAERLGDYRITVEGAPGGMRLSLTTLSGPLRIDGGGKWTRSAGWSVEATASAAPDAAGALGNLGGLLGPPAPDGKYHIRL